MAESVQYITNNTGHIIMLPKHGKWAEGFRLIPGLNRVPKAYFESAYNASRPVADEYGKLVTRKVSRERKVVVKDEKGKESVQTVIEDVEEQVLRYPLRASIERLFTEHVRIVTREGKSIGVRLTRHKDGEVDENSPLGPKPPLDLPGTGADGKNSAALFMVNQCTDRESLVRWAAEDLRDEIRRACGIQLGQIK